MNAVLTPRDWQLLSEYLDNQLGPGARAQVDANITAIPEWAEGLRALDATRTALRSAPHRKAPRNYTLTTLEAASYRQSRFSFPFLKISSAFSAALTILFLVLGITSKNLAVPAMMAAAPAMEQAADSSAEVTAVPIIIWGSPEMNPYAYGMGGGGAGGGMGGGDGGDLSSAEAAPFAGKSADGMNAETIPSAEIQMPSAELAPVPLAVDAAPTMVSEPAPESAPEPRGMEPQATLLSPSAAESAAPAESGNPILGIQPVQEAYEESIPVEPESATPILFWWLAAIGCLLLTVFLGYLGWKPSKPRHE